MCAAALAAIPDPGPSPSPSPSPGDIFFDFEGDPPYQGGTEWGLDYLFGLVETDETFRAFWAHDLAQEKQAVVDFLEYVAGRRRQHPRLHIYHYASYERMHLVSIAAQHDVGEEAVDDLLRCGVLVDLHPIVKQSLRVGSRSYSLKKLEPLYLGTRGRSGVATAVDSITEYVRSRDLIDSGDTDAAARILAEIATCNEYDCISISRSTYRCTTLILSSRSSPPLWPGFRRGSAPLTDPPSLSPLPPSTITGGG